MHIDQVVMPIPDDIETYKLMIDEKAALGSSDILPNAGELHAAIAMSKLFDKTENEVKMVVGRFDGKISDQANYLESMSSCLFEKDIKFKIIFMDGRNNDSLAYQLLVKKETMDKESVQFVDASDEFKHNLSKDGQPHHFSIFDNNKFRFEKNTKKYLAFLSFSNTVFTSELNGIFDDEFKKHIWANKPKVH